MLNKDLLIEWVNNGVKINKIKLKEEQDSRMQIVIAEMLGVFENLSSMIDRDVFEVSLEDNIDYSILEFIECKRKHSSDAEKAVYSELEILIEYGVLDSVWNRDKYKEQCRLMREANLSYKETCLIFKTRIEEGLKVTDVK